MGKSKSFLTPFKKQCFVTLGISLNMASHGFVMGFTSMLVHQLRQPSSTIPVDPSAASWIASIPSVFQILGNFITPSLMDRFGRRRVNLLSITIMIATWFTVATAESVTTLLICRGIQGISLGMSGSLGPVLIGEYTSPNNRGPFLTTVSLAMAVGVLTIHSLGSYLKWQLCAFIVANINFVNLLIVLYSPESPSWLADQGRYAESRTIFKWLRGDEEDEDLNKMIEGSIIVKSEKTTAKESESFGQKIKGTFTYVGVAFRKKEFYKPVFLMIHVYSVGVWCGAVLLTAFLVDLIESIIEPNYHIAIVAISLGIQRLFSNVLAIYLIKKFKRRIVMFVTCGLNTLVLFVTAVYAYTKSKGMLPFDHPAIGIILLHLHMISASTGAIPFPFIIAGELFPLEYKNLASGISIMFFSSTFFCMVKTIPFLLHTLGIQGLYFIYSGLLIYSLIVTYIFLPETKDRTLEDIEDEFRNKKLSPGDLKSKQSLHAWKAQRRCSSPLI